MQLTDEEQQLLDTFNKESKEIARLRLLVDSKKWVKWLNIILGLSFYFCVFCTSFMLFIDAIFIPPIDPEVYQRFINVNIGFAIFGALLMIFVVPYQVWIFRVCGVELPKGAYFVRTTLMTQSFYDVSRELTNFTIKYGTKRTSEVFVNENE